MGEIQNIFDFAGPRVPGDPKVGSHSDCMVSWDTVGGIQALGCPQGPPQTGFGVPRWSRGGVGSFAWPVGA